MIENLKIEKVKKEDLKEVIEVEKECFPQKIAFSEEKLKNFYFKEADNFLVAKIGKEIVGYAIAKKKKIFGEIISLAVKEKWRRKEIGKNLLQKLIENLKKKGTKFVFLHTREKNLPAILLYQKLGFVVLKKIKNYYSNGENAFLMVKMMDG